jgi:membrane-bound metal-dependent hydrolase YbcI (DUF457 family)
MPFTAYHFGPAGFIGLVFKKWIDIPAFVLVNVAVDIEPLILMLRHISWPLHRFCHTLIGAALVGTGLAIALFPFRKILSKIMHLLHLSYEPAVFKMVISGILGGWFHVFIDAIDHWDVQPFLPFNKKNPFFEILSDVQIKEICLVFWLAAILLLVYFYIRGRKKQAALENKP